MRKIWSIHSGQGEKGNERTGRRGDSAGTGRGEFPADSPAVYTGADQNNGDKYVAETVLGAPDNKNDDAQLPGESRKRSARDVRQTKKETKEIRQTCLELLNSKSDSEMTEADKLLLRQYEGAGGLGESDASTHGTLYEFYTPRNVVHKVWQLVDKYIPGAKSVLEPSAGIGRFAEGRVNDAFTLNEYDKISSRISGILNPQHENRQGAFQAMFTPGKAYTGKKYDVVIGNPPYGAYEGLWKGKGEGKEHKRYDEYFIDRGLDTLREGGVMAFVVPSSFLRNGDSAIKKKIAEKGKLLEAWRLPNGTFSTTGVGTDIIILRKEKGDPAQFSDNAYFARNPSMVLGTETTRTGRFGKDEKYVALESGVTFDSVIDSINAASVEAAPVGVSTTKEKLEKKTRVKKAKEPKKSEAEKHHNRSVAMQGNQNARGAHEVDTAAEFNAKYNKHIAPEALPIWKATNWDGSINVLKLENTHYLENSGNYVRTADGRWYDIVNFASGNIYDKLDKLERDKSALSPKEYERQKGILEKALPKPKEITEIAFSPLSDIADKFESGTEIARFSRRNRETDEIEHYDEPLSLKDLFRNWVLKCNSEALGIENNNYVSKQDILQYAAKISVRAKYDKNPATRETNRQEAEETRSQRREVAERLFNQFCRENLPLDDQKRLVEMYNKQYNSTVLPDLDKIPLFLDGISRKFKNDDFKLNETQQRALAWLGNQGNGIAALDVGLGKTIVGILAAINDVQMGRCKRPLITVPKAVYENWKSEIAQVFPSVTINDLGNFNNINAYKGAGGKLDLEEGSISVCTYEALEKIGFTDETIDGDMREVFQEVLALDNAGVGKKKKQRDTAKEDESIMTKVGKATRTGGNWINWEDAGFDHITVDEAHNFRNSFSKPRSKNKGEAGEFDDIPGGSTSLRGLKLFAIAQMVQKRNNGRNVHLLTATPFQNSPVEIYNMLSLVAREKLKDCGIYNFNEFLVQFAELKKENASDSKNNVIQKNVMKGFRNLQALQGLINKYIMKVDGEDAGILRPDKEEHQIYLDPSAEQRDIMERIRSYMETNPDRDSPGAILTCINKLREVALSPALADGFTMGKEIIRVENKKFVEDSPKLKFVADTTAALYKKHPDKGQIIHIPVAVERYDEVKQYLVSKGVPGDAIVFITGKTDLDDREEYTKAFNDPENKVKIVIGSDAIKEGVNLNGNSMQLYSTMLGWNPTDTAQLKGHLHRQGNRQGRVHITFPLMNDSVDSFMYQKHDEKGARLNALWESKENYMDIDIIKPEELKFELIKDPEKRADLIIRDKTMSFKNDAGLARGTSSKIIKMARDRKEFAENIAASQKEMNEHKKAITDFMEKTDEQIIREHDLDFSSKYFWQKQIRDDYGNATGDTIQEVRKNYLASVKENIADAQKSMERGKGKIATIDKTLERYKINDASNDALVEKISKQYTTEALWCEEQINTIEAHRSQYIAEAIAQIKASKRQGISVSEAVAKNTEDVSNNLYSMEVVKEREKKKQTAMQSIQENIERVQETVAEVKKIIENAEKNGKKMVLRTKRKKKAA
jgi:N12 class adenine-specific DNA methylase